MEVKLFLDDSLQMLVEQAMWSSWDGLSSCGQRLFYCSHIETGACGEEIFFLWYSE
jgi:hypothetical protein